MRSHPRRRLIPFAVIGLALACAGGPAGRPASGSPAAEPPAPEPVALRGLDPVLLVVGREVRGRADITLSREGLRYLFAGAASKSEFEKDPERYAVQFHGQCPLMQGARARPDLFTVYKGRIYCFGSEGCREAFVRQPERFLHRRSVVILVFDGMELLDFAGPAEVFTAAGYQVRTVAATRDPVTSAGLVTLKPNCTVADCPPADVIVIPGGSTAVSQDKRVTDWVVRASREAKVTLSVCTGVFVLARAGLLDGKEATTHHGAVEALRARFPRVTVRPDRRVVDNGKVVTSAGVSSGIDGALHVVDRLSGRPAALDAARYMEYPWRPSPESPEPNGAWFGELSLPDDWQLLQLHVAGAPEEIEATLDLPLRNATNLPVKDLRWGPADVAFRVATSLGELEFTGKSNPGEWQGSVKGLKAGGQKPSFRLVRVAAIDVDAYTGGYEAGDGRLITIAPWPEQVVDITRLTVVYTDTRSGRTGSLFPLSPTRFVSGGPVGRVFPVELEVTFDRSPDGKITGLAWREGNAPEVHARKIDSCTEEQVSFSNKDVSLAGTLLVPRGRGPHPAIILTHGSGPQRRWRGIFEQLFVRRGVAVLSYDKRGVGQSTGDWNRSSFTDLADDAVAGANFLKARPDIDARRIGFWGLSQGGWIAPLAASRFAQAAFVVMVAGGGLTPERQELLDTEADLRAAGFAEADIAEALAFQEAKNRFMRTGEGWDEYAKLRQAGVGKKWYGFGNTDAWGPQANDHPYWESCRRIYFYDPAPALRGLRCPVLFISGALDTPRAVRENVANIRTWLQQAGNRDVTIKVFPGAGHNLFVDEPGWAEMLRSARPRYTPGYLELVEGWVVRHAGVDPAAREAHGSR
jgi:putative intracellular protease/amidase/pimeloyl-ACP methyl ester carboxylesterase/YHS domain-containing protein